MNMSSTKKFSKRILAIAMMLMILVGMTALACVPASAANTEVQKDTEGIFYIITGYENGNNLHLIQGGTCFLVNDTHILTAAHIVNLESSTIKAIEAEYGKYDHNKIVYMVILNKDVRIRASLLNKSDADDYAVLRLSDSIGGGVPLTLGYSDEVDTTERVYALGYPTVVSIFQDVRTFNEADVTFTEGLVQKKPVFDGTEWLQHGAKVSEGNSGGPVVDEYGYVQGINAFVPGSAAGTGSEDYSYAVSINQIKAVLKKLNVEYTEAHQPGGGGSVDPDPEPETEKETEITPTEAPTIAPTTPQPTDNNSKDDPEPDNKLGIIIAIVALVVLLIVVLVVVIVLSSKKKNNNNQPPKPPVGPGSGPVGGFTPPMPPQPPVAPPFVPGGSNDGAGETSVLSEGAGETTVLGQSAAGFALIRKSNGQKVNINKPDFTIGKERRRVDYCISDNNSISRAHARLKVRSGRCYICDLGSTNCTYVNGNKLTPNQEIVLSKGDVVKFADEEFVFEG